MALTQRSGALGQVQRQGTASAQNVGSLAQNVANMAARMQFQPAATPRPAAVATFQRSSQPVQQRVPSAAAAQQIVNQAIAQRNNPQPNILQQAGQRALQTALAAAGGQTAVPSFQPRQIRTGQNDRYGQVMRSLVQPGAFDLGAQQALNDLDQTQFQIARTQDQLHSSLMPGVYTPNPQLETQLQQLRALEGDIIKQEQTRLQTQRAAKEQRAQASYPQMTQAYIQNLSDQQLDALLALAPPANPIDPIDASQYQTPPSTAAGAPDVVTGSPPPPGEMSKGPSTPGVDAEQYRYPTQVNAEQYRYPLGPMGWANGYPNRSGTMQVVDAFDDALNRLPTSVTQGGALDDGGGGGFIDTVGDVVGGVTGAAGDIYGWATDQLGDLREAASGTYEAFLETPIGQKIAAGLEWLDTGRVWNTENYGEMFTQWANGEEIAWTSGGSLNPLNNAAAVPVILIGEAIEQSDPGIKDEIKTVAQQGYSSPSYLAQIEAAGIDPATVGPQFTGDRAVWEFLMSKSDDWPPAAKYPFRILTDAIIDPLNYTPMAGKALAAPLKEYAAAVKALETAGDGTKIIGKTAGVAGAAVETIPKIPDLLVEAPFKAAGGIGRRAGEVTGLFNTSTKTGRIIAAEEAAGLDEALQASREGMPNDPVRVAFDAEAQGVVPTSGPELLDTPTVTNAVETPTVVAREGGDSTVVRSTGTATMERETITSPITGNSYPTFESLPAAPRSTTANPSKLYDYNGIQVVIRQGTGTDGTPSFSAQAKGAASARDTIMADSYPDLMDQLPSVLGGSHPTISQAGAPSFTKTGPTLAEVNAQIAELRSNPPAGMTSREAAAEMLRLKTLRNDMRAGRVPSDGMTAQAANQTTPSGTPPATPVEKQAAAAANSVPNQPRNAGEGEMARSASSIKGKKIPTLRNAGSLPNVNKALIRARRLAKEDAENLPRKVNEILRPQRKGEHEFSPIHGGHRPLDRIVTDAIESKDPAKLKRAEQLIKQVDDSVETNLRTDPFYQTWANGGAPIFLADDPRLTDDFFEAFRAFDPDATPERLRVLASGLAKGTLDDIGLLQFQLNHLIPMIAREFPEYLDDLSGVFGAVGRIESKNFREESAQWLVREYLDTPDPAIAETILRSFLTGPTERPVIADGIHKPYAHSIVADYHAESIARLAQMRDQWTKIKQKHAVDDVSDAPFREADIAAQFAGSAKGGGKGISRSIKAEAAKWKKPKPVDIETAIGSIRDPELRRVLLRGDGKLTAEAAMQLDRPIPDSWSPPGYKGFPKLGAPKTEWNMKEGLDWLHEYAAQTPGFDYLKARNELGALMKGIEPRRTKAEVRSMKDAARAAGLDPKIVKDGTSRIEWAASTKATRLLDGYMTALRSLRMYNAITGTPGRFGDILGNMVTHLVAGQDPWSAVRQLPLTFSNTHWYRKAARDPEKLIERWAIDTPHMAEAGATYTKQTFSGSVKLAEEQTTQLPWLNEKAKGAPVGVRAAANLAAVPYLKDITVGGELLGRKLAFDRAFTHSLKHEGLISFLAELKKTYPDTYQQLYKDILSSAQEKGGKRWGGLFSYEDVRKVTDEQTARFWQRKINDAVAKGDAEADRLFFSNRNTNADEVARRTFTFHYWMVRASALYARSFLQNPGMLSGIYRMYAELEQMAQEDNLPGFLGPMFKFYRTSGGMYGAFDPIGILFPTIAFDAYSQEGNKFQAFQNLLNPILGGALGAAGLTQNIPDVTGTRTIERFIIDMGNFLKGEGYDLESIPGLGNYIDNDSLTLKVPTEEFTKFLIGGANAFTGGIFGDFTPFDREANETDQLRSIGIRIGQGLWGEDINTWTPEQVAELEAAVQQAMTGAGEETWLSETIRAEYGREGFVRAGASFFVPGGVVTRQEFRDQQIEASRDYWDSFYAGKPTTKEGESAAAGRQLATSTQPVWVAMNNAYYEIGTKEQQQQYSVYNDLLFNPEELNSGTTIVVDNGNGTYTFFTAGELAGMEYADRFKILEAWAANTEGMADAIKIVGEGRKQFKAEHPDYAAYSEYQKGVYGYDGGPNQFRKDMADHPQFAAAMEAKRKDLVKQGKTGAVLEAELDSWAASQQAFFAMMGEPWKLDDNLPGGTPGPSSVFAMDRLRPKDEEGSSSSGSTGGKTVKDPNVDDYWSPEKGVPRLAQDYAQYEFDNAEMERRFGPYWNEAAAEWEDHADSAKERDNLGIGDKPYVLPSTTETMRRYEAWEEEHPGGTPEEFFAQMLVTEGFGKKVQSGGQPTTNLPAGGTTYTPGTMQYAVNPNSAIGKALSGIPPARVKEPTASTTEQKANGKVAIFGGKSFGLSQEYGMTDFARTQSNPNGIYGYTDQYSTDGSYVGHMGLDLAAPLGTPLYAPVSGVVVQAGGMPYEQDDRYEDQPQTGGLRIERPNGDIVVMAHMQQITVKVGDTVEVGQPVGYSGTAGADPGDPGAGAHLHLEYRKYAPGTTGSGYLAIDPRDELELGV